MKVRAAVANQANAQLEITEVDLAGPKQGEVMVEIKATGICHTDAYTLSGRDPEGIFPSGIGAGINTAKVQVADGVVVVGLGGIGLNVVQGARLAGASMIVGIDLNPARGAIAEKFGMTQFVNPAELAGDLVPYLVDLTK